LAFLKKEAGSSDPRRSRYREGHWTTAVIDH